jgi:hypothetical protein
VWRVQVVQWPIIEAARTFTGDLPDKAYVRQPGEYVYGNAPVERLLNWLDELDINIVLRRSACAPSQTFTTTGFVIQSGFCDSKNILGTIEVFKIDPSGALRHFQSQRTKAALFVCNTAGNVMGCSTRTAYLGSEGPVAQDAPEVVAVFDPSRLDPPHVIALGGAFRQNNILPVIPNNDGSLLLVRDWYTMRLVRGRDGALLEKIEPPIGPSPKERANSYHLSIGQTVFTSDSSHVVTVFGHDDTPKDSISKLCSFEVGSKWLAETACSGKTLRPGIFAEEDKICAMAPLEGDLILIAAASGSKFHAVVWNATSHEIVKESMRTLEGHIRACAYGRTRELFAFALSDNDWREEPYGTPPVVIEVVPGIDMFAKDRSTVRIACRFADRQRELSFVDGDRMLVAFGNQDRLKLFPLAHCIADASNDRN